MSPAFLSNDGVHAVLLDILRSIVSICDRQRVEVFLIGGGCLGLVRHGGFVPWDDDLDLAIWAGDVPAFVKAMDGLPGHLTIRTEPKQYDPSYYSPIYKVMDTRTHLVGGGADENDGIFVDIVPMMHWRSRTRKSIENRFCRMAGFRNGYSNERHAPSLFNRVGETLARWVLRRRLYPVFLRDDSECRAQGKGIVTGALGRRWIGKFEYDIIFPLQRTSFCGVEVSAPRDLHGFLQRRYGADYMTELEEDKRWRHFTSAAMVSGS
jgi:lipopolysaccharide cholinephosphotransferase